MNLRHWAGIASVLTLISLATAGCGGGGSSSSVVVPDPTSVSATPPSIEGRSGSKAVTNPIVSEPTLDPATGLYTVSLTDPATGKTLNNVAVPSDPRLRPRTGQPAVVVNADELDFGTDFNASKARGQVTRDSAPKIYVTLYDGDTLDSAHELMKIEILNNKLQNSVAIGAADGTYALGFVNVKMKTNPGKSLVLDHLNFIFQTRVVSGQLQVSMPTTIKGVLAPFGEQITHDPTKKDWTGGGVQFTMGAGAKGGTAELKVQHANGTIDKKVTIGNAGSANGETVSQILTESGGPLMGDPCQKVELTCLFPG
jgi:hypothetical protein